MQTREIPQDQWQQFLDDFSQMHQNWQTSVEMLGMDLGDQQEAEAAPLQGISFDPTGSQAGDIEIALGDSPDDFQSHHISKPRHVRVVDSQPGAQTDLEIQSADGFTTIVHCRPSKAMPA